MINSQKRLDPDKFDNILLDFALAHMKTFPNVDVYNKLHFLLHHYPDFVRRYHMCGRKSAESHESVHTLLSRLKESVKRMASTQKQFNTIFSRSLSILKPDMAQVQNKLSDNKKNRRTTGNYNTNKAIRRQDKVEFTAAQSLDLQYK